MNFKKNSAIILCGGRGTRLGSIGKKIPKSLIKINGHPIIWYIMNNLVKNSFNHFILPVGYKGNLIKRLLISSVTGQSPNCPPNFLPILDKCKGK